MGRNERLEFNNIDEIERIKSLSQNVAHYLLMDETKKKMAKTSIDTDESDVRDGHNHSRKLATTCPHSVRRGQTKWCCPPNGQLALSPEAGHLPRLLSPDSKNTDRPLGGPLNGSKPGHLRAPFCEGSASADIGRQRTRGPSVQEVSFFFSSAIHFDESALKYYKMNFVSFIGCGVKPNMME